MEELDRRGQEQLEGLEIGQLPYLPEGRLQMSDCKTYRLDDLAALGVAVKPLTVAIQNVFGGEGTSGIYYVNTKGMSMHQFKNGAGYLGSLKNASGGVGGGQAIINKIYCDPTMIFMSAALMNIEQKLARIEQLQQQMMDFLEAKERANVRGNVNTLVDVLNNYKFNVDNETYKSNKHILVQDIRRDAEQSIQLYRSRLQQILGKRTPVSSDQELKSVRSKTREVFGDYQMALYLYAFSSYLEVLLLGNFDHEYLNSVKSRIQDLAIGYRELYTDCYSELEHRSQGSVLSVLMRGAAGITKGAGQTIAKIPVLSKGTVDETLVSSGEKLEKYTEQKTERELNELREIAGNCTEPFLQSIDELDHLYSEPKVVLFDRENLYILDAAS